ncbi:hypothetical protein FGB62_94g063 [Gracilaria domingensis]|nr:hypothetical protein FGB62_94g063 [Gracilaria domingensis]
MVSKAVRRRCAYRASPNVDRTRQRRARGECRLITSETDLVVESLHSIDPDARKCAQVIELPPSSRGAGMLTLRESEQAACDRLQATLRGFQQHRELRMHRSGECREDEKQCDEDEFGPDQACILLASDGGAEFEAGAMKEPVISFRWEDIGFLQAEEGLQEAKAESPYGRRREQKLMAQALDGGQSGMLTTLGIT